MQPHPFPVSRAASHSCYCTHSLAKYTPFFLSPTTGDKGGTGQEVLMQMQETGVSRLVVLRWEVLGALNSPEKDLQAVGMG